VRGAERYAPGMDAENLVVVGSGPAGVSAARAYREAGGTGPGPPVTKAQPGLTASPSS
jgi:NADPH-dependent 2,4-dienoyl-CoA reductase/sulfur reductase-like enzyme